jgi:transcriptional regulator with XRE-family HTH domain
MTRLSSKIKELRKRTGMTQQQIAVAAGLGVRTVAGYEIGDRTPEPGPLLRFAAIAAERGLSDLASSLMHEAITQLGVQGPTLILSHRRESRESPLVTDLIAIGHVGDIGRYLGAAGIALAMLRSKNPEQQARARAALEKLAAEV